MNLIKIDSREPASIEGEIKRGNPLMPYVVEELAAGDFHIESDDGLVILERKTPSDLIASIKDKRLSNQIAGCLEMTPNVYLIIEGEIRSNDAGFVTWPIDGLGMDLTQSSGMRFAALWGILTRVQHMGAIVRFYREGDLYKTLASCAKMAKRDRPIDIEPRQPADWQSYSEAERILTSFPKIGIKDARTLLSELGSLAYALWFLSTPDDRDWKVKGIGPKKREAALQALGGFGLMPMELSRLQSNSAAEDEPERT